MYSPTHRPSMSVSNLATPPSPKQRRMSSPVPPPAPLDLPEPTSHFIGQPNPSRSPLRNGVTLDPVTGALSEDGSSSDTDGPDPWGTRDRDQMSQSPSSVTRFASSFAQRVGSLVTSVSPSSQPSHLPSEAEIEAEAELQRERSRREAERILTQEAVERKKVEERVLEMLEASRNRPTRSHTTPSPGAPPSPTKETGSWWSAAKSKLTPTKDKDLTPAQQIVLDTKAREKERRKSRDKEWPTNGKTKYSDPAFQQLTLPPGARPPGGQVGGGANAVPLPPSPGSPSPHSRHPPRQLTASPTAITPSSSRDALHPAAPPNPHHNNNSAPHNPGVQHPLPRVPAASPLRSASSDAQPLYAQFSSQGVLDVPGTLITIARRFEKLERWAVGHTRALEERMSDVEKWLVDKEREREREAAAAAASTKPSVTATKPDSSEKDTPVKQVVREVTIERKTVEVDQEVKREVGEMKEELGELRGRVGELGREMARLASSVTPHSVSPSEASGFGIGRIASPPAETPAPSPSPRTLPSVPPQAMHTQSPSAYSIAQSETASIISSGTGTSTRTKLPYPSGDYTSPSPPPPPSSRSPPFAQNYSANNASSGISRTRPLSYSGLPIPQTTFPSTGSGASSRAPAAGVSPAQSAPAGSNRTVSTSPSPRKRYTVALGQPLSSSSSSSPSTSTAKKDSPPFALGDRHAGNFGQSEFSEEQAAELHTAYFTDVLEEEQHRQLDGHDTGDDEEEQQNHEEEEGKEGAQLARQETIGKTPITLSRLSLSPPPSQNSSPNNRSSLQRERSSPTNPRIRAQSTYGVPGSASTSSTPAFGREDTSPSDNKGSWRTRSRSIDRVGLGLGIDAGRGVSNFVDPLVVRKKEKDGTAMRSPPIVVPATPRGRVPFGDLLAFFDAEKQ